MNSDTKTYNYGENTMTNNYFSTNNYAIANKIPHCPVILVLDTSHSMWGKGLADLKHSLQAFFDKIGQENNFSEFIDIAAVSMGDNLGMIEEFTPFQLSTLPALNIRPKGDTPLGAALDLAMQKLEAQLAHYQTGNIKSVTPQMIVLSDGKSSDDHSFAVNRLNAMVKSGRLLCRTIALGDSPDMRILNQIGATVIANDNSMPEAFADAGEMVSQVYEEEIPEVIMGNPVAEQIPCGTEYIIDGANVLYSGRKDPSLRRIIALSREFMQKSIPFRIIFDATTPHRHLKHKWEKQYYEKLFRDYPEHFYQAPAGHKADDFILQYTAAKPECVIITQDLYRDYRDRYREARRRVIGVMDLNDILLLPEINMNIKVDKNTIY